MGRERHRSDSFVFRIWWEDEGWRGWVQHAASGESCYFERLDDLLAFVEAQTGPLAQVAADRAGKGNGDK